MKSKRELAMELNKALARYERLNQRRSKCNGVHSPESLEFIFCEKCFELKEAEQELAEAREAMNSYNSAQILHNEMLQTKRLNESIDKRLFREEQKASAKKAKEAKVKQSTKKKEQKKMTKEITWTNLTKAQQTFLVGQFVYPEQKLTRLAEKIGLGNSTIYNIKALLKDHIEAFNELTKAGKCPLPSMLVEMQVKASVEEVFDHVEETVETAQTPQEATPAQTASEEEIEIAAPKVPESIAYSSYLEVLAKLDNAETDLRTLHDEIAQRQQRFDDDMARLDQLEELRKIAESKLKVSELRNKELESALEAAKERAMYHQADKEKALLAQERQFQKDLALERQDRKEVVGQKHYATKLGAFVPEPVDFADVQALISINEILHKNLSARLERTTYE